jgi:hypothetical protein
MNGVWFRHAATLAATPRFHALALGTVVRIAVRSQLYAGRN